MKEKFKGKIFGFADFIRVTDKAAYAAVHYRKELKLIDKNFRSRIMLAVTRVNGCAICSYVHTKAALESGSSEEDINTLLEGDLQQDPEQAVALVFAQHYADSAGDYDEEAFARVVEAYGEKKAYGILAAIKVIMFGNAHGISATLLKDRLTGNPQKGSSFLNEIGITLGALLIMPFMLVKGLFTRKKTVSCKN